MKFVQQDKSGRGAGAKKAELQPSFERRAAARGWLRRRSAGGTLIRVTRKDEVRSLQLFAVTAPGLERLCAAELREVGIHAVIAEGGAAWHGDMRTVYRANLELRTASRIVARVGEFRARTFGELERHAARLPWDLFLTRDGAVKLRVTCRKSRLYHEGAVAERVAGILADRTGARAVAGSGPAAEDDGSDAQLIVIRCLRDRFTISADASGTLLHQRGYRQALAQAPLRETLAAAMLLASGWRGTTPLLDPLCGSGTIPIEAALLARRIAPGLANPELSPRRFAFERWPVFDDAAWHDIVDAARSHVRPDAGISITGSDRNGGAIAAAHANAERAGVAQDITFVRRALSAAETRHGPGHLVTNPPYGVRVGNRRALESLYVALGRLVADRLPGWSMAVLSAEPRLDTAIGLPLKELLRTRNGGIPVRLLAAVPERTSEPPSDPAAATGADAGGPEPLHSSDDVG